MSWQAYVDNNLVGTGNVKQAALLGHDGTVWASSEGFTVSENRLYPQILRARQQSVCHSIYIPKQ